MTSSEFETDDTRPVAARCDDQSVHVELADGRAEIELQFSGIWFPKLDEGLSVKGLLLGWRAPGAAAPGIAAE